VTLVSPTDGARLDEGSNITLVANASDSDGTVAQVEFYQGGTLLGTDASSPISSYGRTFLEAITR